MTDDLRRTLASLAHPPLLPADGLDDLHDRWRRRRRRRTAVRATLAAAAALIVLAGGVTLIDHDRQPGTVGVTATAPSTTALTTTAPSVTMPTTAVVVPDPTTTAPSQATTRPAVTTIAPTTAAPLVCRNSRDPACGPFRWDPSPVESTLDVKVALDPPNPKAGQEVTFNVEVSGKLVAASATVTDPGNGTQMRTIVGGISCADVLQVSPPFGPWDLPAPHGPLTNRYAATYATPGTYTAHFTFATFNCSIGDTNPYPGRGDGSVIVVVSP